MDDWWLVHRSKGTREVLAVVEPLDAVTSQTALSLSSGLWGNVSAPGARRASFVTHALPLDCCR